MLIFSEREEGFGYKIILSSMMTKMMYKGFWGRSNLPEVEGEKRQVFQVQWLKWKTWMTGEQTPCNTKPNCPQQNYLQNG